MFPHAMKITLLAAFSCYEASGQLSDSLQSDSLPVTRVLDINPRSFRAHDTVWVYSGICKPLKKNIYSGKLVLPYLNLQEERSSLLRIHGNIQYDFTYRSLVDTPFYQKNFAQHTLQTVLDITVKEHYPIRVTLLTRQSNSPWFRDITDVNIQFNQRNFLQELRTNIAAQLSALADKRKLPGLEKLYQQKLWEAESLRNWISHPGRLQEIIEAGERTAGEKLMAGGKAATDSLVINIPTAIPKPGEIPSAAGIRKKVFDEFRTRLKHMEDSLRYKADSLQAATKGKTDSLQQKDLLSQYRKKKGYLDTLEQEIKKLEVKLKNVKTSIRDSLALLKQQLAQIKDPQQLKKFIADHKLDAQQLPKGWKALSAIKAIGIGRTWVDYSDLTVKNISLTGVNAELNPGKFYFAAAAGKVNYRFRDFVINNHKQPAQPLYIIRAGVGKAEGNHLIFSWYDGKRNLLRTTATSIAVQQLPERVMGMSAEAKFQLDENNHIVLESAKSSFHTTGTAAQPSSGLVKKVWNFRDHSNEAWSIRLYSFLPQSNTKINGFFRKSGANFQSFNLQPVNTGQEAYQLKVQQTFWRKRLQLDAGIRKNDFSSPFVNPGLNSKTVFKSIQATLRMPKFPFISAGYFPSSQLTVLDNNIIGENQYNTFSMVVSHAWRFKGISMSSNAVYLKFFNSGADTGFIYFNASSFAVNQFVFMKNLQLQTGYAYTSNRELKVKVLEQTASYQVKDWLMLSGGVKMNRLNGKSTLWGGNGGLGLNFKKLGTIQLSYDRSFLPGTRSNLLPVDMGRVGYSRVF